MMGDDLIGSTVIDVEDRLRSRHRAFNGIALQYSRFSLPRYIYFELVSLLSIWKWFLAPATMHGRIHGCRPKFWLNSARAMAWTLQPLPIIVYRSLEQQLPMIPKCVQVQIRRTRIIQLIIFWNTDESMVERLSLCALHKMESLPYFGYKLVPEHVETRSLYRPDRPGIEQVRVFKKNSLLYLICVMY